MIGGLGYIFIFFALHWTLNWSKSIDNPKKIPMEKNVFKWVIFVIGWLLLLIQILGYLLLLSI